MNNKKSDIYLALLHYPVTRKTGEASTTNITNIDLHDIARTSRTYGVKKFFVVNPLDSQIMLAERILHYWTDASGARKIPDRKEALGLVEIRDRVENVTEQISRETGEKPILVATDAREYGKRISYHQLKENIRTQHRPYLLLFGTGYGLTYEFLDKCDLILAPIRGTDHYNHLSVRAAVAITLDRLFGDIQPNPTAIYENDLNISTKKEKSYASNY